MFKYWCSQFDPFMTEINIFVLDFIMVQFLFWIYWYFFFTLILTCQLHISSGLSWHMYFSLHTFPLNAIILIDKYDLLSAHFHKALSCVHYFLRWGFSFRAQHCIILSNYFQIIVYTRRYFDRLTEVIFTGFDVFLSPKAWPDVWLPLLSWLLSI